MDTPSSSCLTIWKARVGRGYVRPVHRTARLMNSQQTVERVPSRSCTHVKFLSIAMNYLFEVDRCDDKVVALVTVGYVSQVVTTR